MHFTEDLLQHQDHNDKVKAFVVFLDPFRLNVTIHFKSIADRHFNTVLTKVVWSKVQFILGLALVSIV